MKVTLNLKCCKHCVYYVFIDTSGEFLDDSNCNCSLTSQVKKDDESCDSFMVDVKILDEIQKFACDCLVKK